MFLSLFRPDSRIRPRLVHGRAGRGFGPLGVPRAHAGTLTGPLPSGNTYLIEVPRGWNGTLVCATDTPSLAGLNLLLEKIPNLS